MFHATVLQAVFDEEPTVQERVNDLTSLASQMSAALDVNDDTTLKTTVNDISRRLNMVSVAARHREMSLLNGVAMWNDFQVTEYLILDNPLSFVISLMGKLFVGEA